MKKNLFLAALAFVALASCTSDEFVGENTSPTTSSAVDAIRFESSASKITRATSNDGTVVEKLDGQFKVYGVKSGTTAGSEMQKVFPNYSVWDATANTTTSNDSGWEYVGASGTSSLGTGNISLSSDQTIKYWDHNAADYRFVAGSPIGSFTYTVNSTTNAIASASVTGLAGHINANPTSNNQTPALTTNPVYIATPLIITETNYRKPVTFNFVRQQSRVRVGVYETIPGYKITNIQFYTCTAETTPTWSSSANNTQNIILASATANYFVGGSNASATVTYNWSGSESGVTYPNYTFTYNESGLTKQNNWYGGLLDGVKAVTSNHSSVDEFFGTDKDMDASGYFTVIPTPTATTAAPLLIKCDYTLTSLGTSEGGDGSGETITIHGATAAVPAAFSKWAPNTSYTYLFKISDNTNGVTSTSHTDKVGLFPITFDAVAVAEATGTEQGTITTVSIPSITTYQVGSVVDVVDAQNPDNSKHGIEYKAGKEIYLTVQNNETGELNTLKTDGTAGTVHVYKLNSAMTEADLQVTPPSSSSGDLFSLCSTATTVEVTVGSDTYKTVTLPANQHGKFTPSEEGYYAIQYVFTAAVNTTPAVYAYKVVYVNPAS